MKNSKLFFMNIKKTGFTLIELLVVISIIGILASLGVANFQDARARARDTKRKSDLKQIQKALEIFRQDNNTFPTGSLSVLSGSYMNSVPTDPSPGLSYNYISPRIAGDKYTFQIYACLENGSDPDKDGIKQDSCTTASYTLQES